MKILVFEYITGGGFNKQDLPSSLAQEGKVMLQALLDNLSVIAGVELELMLDWRLWGKLNTTGINTVLINPQQDFLAKFRLVAQHCDAVWPIAPESDGILHSLCRIIENLDIRLLNSPAAAVAITGNKMATYLHLLAHGIATVPTQRFDKARFSDGEYMVKSIDGVGCADSYLVTNQDDWGALPPLIDHIIQPHVDGAKTSLSCLFKAGQAWLLCANNQEFALVNKQYQLTGITVNFSAELDKYQSLVAHIAKAFPDLWGYAGIDLIETPEQILVLEINPRLTSSFVGIQQALGLNVAGLVLQMLKTVPTIRFRCNQAVHLNFIQASHVN